MNMRVKLGSLSLKNIYWEVCVEVSSAGRTPPCLPEASWLPIGCLVILMEVGGLLHRGPVVLRKDSF